MTLQTPRELLAEADRQRALANGADDLRRRIRLGRDPVQEKRSGILGWWRDRSTAPNEDLVEPLPTWTTRAMYDALTIVQQEAEQRADALEARVVTEEKTR